MTIKIEFTGTLDLTKPVMITDAAGVHVMKEVIDVPTPPEPPSTGSYWRGDAETGDLSQWARIAAEPGRISVVTNPVSQGKYAYRFELRPGDDVSGSRCQLDSGIGMEGKPNTHYIEDGDEAYYGVSFYLPIDTLKRIAKWRQFIQWKGIHTGSPPLQISLNDDKWRVYYRPNISSSNIMKWTAPCRRDVWEKFTLHVKWSVDPKIGFFEVYYNGVLVIPKFFTSLIHIEGGEKRKNVIDIGNYRDDGVPYIDVMYVDGFVAGMSYEEVKQ